MQWSSAPLMRHVLLYATQASASWWPRTTELHAIARRLDATVRGGTAETPLVSEACMDNMGPAECDATSSMRAAFAMAPGRPCACCRLRPSAG